MSDLTGRWEEARIVWRRRTQRYAGDPVTAAGVIRRRLATKLAGVDPGASVSLEYSLPVLRETPWLTYRAEVDECSFARCPDACPVSPPLNHTYSARSNYVLNDALVDTRSGFTYVDHLGRRALIRESTSWPASQALWSASRPKSGPIIDEPLTVLSSPSNYFHFLTEDFPALLRVLEMWPDAVVGVRSGTRPGFVDDALRAVNKVPLELDRVIRATTLYMAGRGQDLGYLRSKDHQLLSRCLFPPEASALARVGGPPRIVYASRTGATRAGTVDAEASKVAVRFGATIVDFATLNIFDQAKVCREADMVIGCHGAALVNALSCRSRSTLVEVIPAAYHNRCYEWLAHICELDYQPIYGTSDLQAFLKTAL